MALVATHLSLLPPDPPESCQLDPLAGRNLLLWLSGTERHSLTTRLDGLFTKLCHFVPFFPKVPFDMDFI